MRTRNRKYFITINKSAPCYNKIEPTLNKIKNGTYFLITHKKNQEQEHKHLILEYTDAKSLETIKKTYQGAHIEVCAVIPTAVKYLLHKNHKAIVEGKEPYTAEEISTNNIEKLNDYLNEKEVIKLDENEIYRYIVDHDFQVKYLSPIYLLNTYGNQYFKYERFINEYRKSLNSDPLEIEPIILNLVDTETRSRYYERNGQIFDSQSQKINFTQTSDFSDQNETE